MSRTPETFCYRVSSRPAASRRHRSPVPFTPIRTIITTIGERSVTRAIPAFQDPCGTVWKRASGFGSALRSPQAVQANRHPDDLKESLARNRLEQVICDALIPKHVG